MFVALLAGLWLITPDRASAHSELVRADPPVDGLLAAPPRRLELWFSEPVDTGAGSPSLVLLDDRGEAEQLSNVAVDPADAYRVVADVPTVGEGTYTVRWEVRSAADGHTLNGAFAFRVGSGRAPGAATVQGEEPRAWAVATRWLTFLGAALAGGGYLFARLILPGADAATVRRRTIAVAGGFSVALVATLVEPVLQTQWPPAGTTIKPTLSEAIQGLPNAWWLRPAALVAGLILGLALLVLARRGRRAPVEAEWAGLALAFVALLGLSLTSHASARADWRAVAVASNVVHQWAVSLWVGGLAHLALSWRPMRTTADEDERAPELDPIRRFSWLALPIVLVGLGTGVANAGLVLPTLRSLWDSTYGGILLVKVGVLVPALALATFHRAALRRMIERTGAALRTTVRVEAALVLLVVLGGSVLALLAPPAARAGTAKMVDLAAPVDDASGALQVRLQVAPARPGANQVTVLIAGADGAPLPSGQVQLVRIDLISLDHTVERRGLDAPPDGEGGYAVDGVQLSLDGWWRAEVTIRRQGVPDVVVPFYLILPDPNVNGFDEPPEPSSSDEAAAVYARGLTTLASLHRVRWTQRLSGGTGTVVVADFEVSDGSDGNPVAATTTAGKFRTVTVGDRQWIKQEEIDWIEREAAPVIVPADWLQIYEGATGFRLGATEEVDGELCQIVTFFVPATGQTRSAWYAWWVGVDSGLLRRETMVSSAHYMVYSYRDFDAPFVITPPSVPGAPATPSAG